MGESSDCRQRKVTESEKCKNRVLELSRSFKKAKKSSSKKKRSSREEPAVQRASSRANGSDEIKEVGEIVADILAPMRIGLERGSRQWETRSALLRRLDPASPPRNRFQAPAKAE